MSDLWGLRILEYERTKNWVEGESDPAWIVRMESYKKTKNWTKALNDVESFIRDYALAHLRNTSIIN